MTKVGDTLPFGMTVEEIQEWMRNNRGFSLGVDGDRHCLVVEKSPEVKA